jgi:hypothetical protein
MTRRSLFGTLLAPLPTKWMPKPKGFAVAPPHVPGTIRNLTDDGTQLTRLELVEHYHGVLYYAGTRNPYVLRDLQDR